MFKQQMLYILLGRTYNPIIDLGFLQSDDYKFLIQEPILGNNIELLGFAGSFARGIATPDSDIDLRGVATLRKQDYATLNDWKAVDNPKTDTLFYSHTHFLNLISKGNPSVLEILGLRKEDYIYIGPVGEYLLDNYTKWISKRSIRESFIGYVFDQLASIENAQLKSDDDFENLRVKLNNIYKNKCNELKLRYRDLYDSSINIWRDEESLKCSIDIKDTDFNTVFDIVRDIKNIQQSTSKLGKRNTKRTDAKLSKHCASLVAVLTEGIDLLNTGEMRTSRQGEYLDLIKDIRSGRYVKDLVVSKEMYTIADELKADMEEAYRKSDLRDVTDLREISKAKCDIYNIIENY